MSKNFYKYLACAFSVVVLVLVFCVGLVAYPAQNVVPPSSSIDVPGNVDSYTHIVANSITVDDVYAAGGLDFFFGNVLVEPGYQAGYKQVSFDLVPGNAGATGWWSVNFGGTSGKNFFTRVGSYFGGVDNYPYNVRGDTYTFSSGGIMLGFRLAPVSDSSNPDARRVSLTLQYYYCTVVDNVYTVDKQFSITYLVPEQYTVFQLRIVAQNYMGVDCAYVSSSTALPHLPSDLVDYGYVLDKDGNYTTGYEDGLTDGKKQGYEVGYSDGFIDGGKKETAVTRTIWQIISMPFDLLMSILNFEILGINVWALVSGLLSVGLVLFLLRKVGII